MRVLVALALAAALAGCGGGAAGEQDLSSEGAIATAQAAAAQTRAAFTPTEPPTPVPPTPTPVLETATPTVTATPDAPIVTASYHAYVRAGPGADFEAIDFFLEGQRAEVIGRFENPVDGTWWYVRRIEVGRDGWVWSGAVTLGGDAGRVPAFATPPVLPTPAGG